MTDNARSIEAQTGWKRPFKHTICQEMDVLIKITEHSFDLDNAHFIEYCERRGVLSRVGVEHWTIIVDETKAEYFAKWRLAMPQADGERYRFTDDEMETHWGIHCRGLGMFQDVWELFNANVRYNF